MDYDIDEELDLDNEDDDDEYCPTCNGTGEGMYDGSRCSKCGGLGVITEREEPDADYYRDMDR